jgi:TRAP-type mannitol/chloroaromatic compound transport system permease small subunit
LCPQQRYSSGGTKNAKTILINIFLVRIPSNHMESLRSLIQTINFINRWTGRICSVSIAVLVILTVVEVILRRIFNSPTIWSFEVTKQIYGFYFMILAGYTLLKDSHVSVDILYTKFGKKQKCLLDVLTYAIFFFPFTFAVFYKGIGFAKESWAVYETSWSVFAPPLYPIKTVIPVTGLLLILQGFAIFVQKLIYLCTNRRVLHD